MSRSGYVEDFDDNLVYGRWRAQVSSAIRGKRGQAFLKELAAAMDAMPVKRLISGELITESGEVCAIGSICKARGLETKNVDIYDSEAVGNLVGIARQLAAEIEYMNDEFGPYKETAEDRWTRMREWVQEQIKESNDEG